MIVSVSDVEGIEAYAAQRFAADTAEHQMTVLRDDGLYRHLRFNKPGTYIYGFDVVTWPGYLTIVGDCGDYIFARISDMFEFFTAPEINPHYWGQKVQGGGGRDMTQSYSERMLQEQVKDWFTQTTGLQLDGTICEWAQDDEVPGELPDDWTVGSALALSRALEEDVLLSYEYDITHDQGAHEALQAFEFPRRDERPHGARPEVTIGDSWEWDLREHDYHFLWCCHAVRWGVEQYNASKKEETSAVGRSES